MCPKNSNIPTCRSVYNRQCAAAVLIDLYVAILLIDECAAKCLTDLRLYVATFLIKECVAASRYIFLLMCPSVTRRCRFKSSMTRRHVDCSTGITAVSWEQFPEN